MIWALVVILVFFWILGFAGRIAGNMIHILLALALIAVIYNLFTNRRT